MATAVLAADNLTFTTNGSTVAAKITATADTLDFSGATGGTDVTITGIDTITVSGTPSASGDLVTKNYVDNAVNGLQWTAPVVAATTTNGTLASAFANGQTIDDVTLVTGERILLKNQSTGSENGIYTVNSSGAPTRVTELAATMTAAGVAVFVSEGTTNADKGFVCTNDAGSDVVGTDALTFTQFTSAGGGLDTAGTGCTSSGSTLNVIGGAGLTANANDMAVNVDDSTIEINSDNLRIKALGVGTAQLAAGAVTSAKIAALNVGTAQLAADAVDGTKIADNAVDSEHIAAGAIDSEHFSTGCIDTAAFIANDLIDSQHYAAASIDTEHIGNAQVTTAKIADDNVTGAKIAAAVFGHGLSFANDVVVASHLAKHPVRAATTTNGTLATAFANGQIIDGVTLATGDRILLQDQTDQTANGIYVVESSGAPTRASDADTTALVGLHAYVKVMEGTVNANRVFYISTSPATLGSNNMVWSEWGITAGTGLEVTAGTMGISAGGVDTAQLATGAVESAKIGNGQVDSQHYVVGSIDTAHIGNLQVTTAKIAADAIDGTKLADNAVNSEHITDGSVDMVHMANDSGTLGSIGQSNIVTTNSNGNITLNGDGASDHGDITATYGISTFVNHVSTSDRTLKDKIQDISEDEAERVVKAIRPVNYVWKANGEPDSGFIAQDMQKVAPQLVHTIPSGANKGKLSLEYAKFTAYNTRVIQSLMARIDVLEGKSQPSKKRKASSEEGGDDKRR